MLASAFATSSSICMKTLDRRFRAAERFRQQRAIKAVVDQAADDRLRQPPRPLDLVGLARDQRRERPRALDEIEAGELVHARSGHRRLHAVCGAIDGNASAIATAARPMLNEPI